MNVPAIPATQKNLIDIKNHGKGVKEYPNHIIFPDTETPVAFPANDSAEFRAVGNAHDKLGGDLAPEDAGNHPLKAVFSTAH